MVWRQGPSSGQPGSRALITADGQVHGWIGGACAEPVVIREAQRVIRAREPQLLLLGHPDAVRRRPVPDGMVYVPMSCQSEGALQVYIEPVVPTLDLVVVGRSPMAHTLADLANALGWRGRRRRRAASFTAADIDERARSSWSPPRATATRRRSSWPCRPRRRSSAWSPRASAGEALLGYLAERGVPQELLDRVHTPVGLDLGHTSHREIAVAVLAELVQLRAAGAFTPPEPATAPARRSRRPPRRSTRCAA